MRVRAPPAARSLARAERCRPYLSRASERASCWALQRRSGMVGSWWWGACRDAPCPSGRIVWRGVMCRPPREATRAGRVDAGGVVVTVSYIPLDPREISDIIRRQRRKLVVVRHRGRPRAGSASGRTPKWPLPQPTTLHGTHWWPIIKRPPSESTQPCQVYLLSTVTTVRRPRRSCQHVPACRMPKGGFQIDFLSTTFSA